MNNGSFDKFMDVMRLNSDDDDDDFYDDDYYDDEEEESQRKSFSISMRKRMTISDEPVVKEKPKAVSKQYSQTGKKRKWGMWGSTCFLRVGGGLFL